LSCGGIVCLGVVLFRVAPSLFGGTIIVLGISNVVCLFGCCGFRFGYHHHRRLVQDKDSSDVIQSHFCAEMRAMAVENNALYLGHGLGWAGGID
jgi:hypothetical protein